MATRLSQHDADSLHAEPSVRNYRPKAVQFELIRERVAAAAVCYNLPRDLEASSANTVYARELAALARDLGFNDECFAEIAQFETER